MEKTKLIQFLDEYLQINQYEDSSKNGLQVDNSKKEIKKIWYAVDANSYIFDKAIQEKVDMIICHHGMFRWYEETITWLVYKRINKLISNNIALYACHLPLDWHNEVGNNMVMLNKFIDIFQIKNPLISQNKPSFGLKFNEKIKIQDIVDVYCNNLWLEKKFYNFWNLDTISSIYFSSGGGLFSSKFAKENNFNLLITWEWAHYEITLSKELKQSVVLWWHYETEVFGVQALSEKLKKDFNLEIVFLDEKY